MTTHKAEIIELPQPLGLFAGDLFDRASEFLSAFRQCAEQSEMYPKYFLVSHSLELYLKSYLAAKGVSKSELKSRKLGHNLDDIYRLCESKSIPHVLRLKHFCRAMQESNGDFDFRYPTGYIVRVPSPKLCLEVMDPLHSSLNIIITQVRLQAKLQLANDTRHLQGKKLRWSD